jgi:LysM repeat protein
LNNPYSSGWTIKETLMFHKLHKSVAIMLLVIVLAAPVIAQENVHIVQPGENLFRIAVNYNVTVNALAEANGIANTWHITAGQRLVIPGTTPEFAALVESAPVEADPVEAAPEAAAAPEYHIIQSGETLFTIARQYGLTAAELIRLNNITNPNLIYAGQRLIVGSSTAEASEAPAESVLPEIEVPPEVQTFITASTATHTVSAGERLSQIAERYGVSWLAIARLNGIADPNTIYAGQELAIPSSVLVTTETNALPAAPPPVHGVGREIIVDLSDSRTYAYEDGRLVRNVLVSTGRPETPTVLGDYTIQRKYVSQTMSGPGYYLPGVPYVLYFYAGYAFHGTYWHENWGQPMSHGCVNMPTPEAEWLYNWADIGTRVRVQA